MNKTDKISDEEIAQLTSEIHRAECAKTAYDVYIKEHIGIVTRQLFEEFSNTSVENMDKVMEIKRLQSAVKSLEISILNDIDTGKLAAARLEIFNLG